MIDGLGVGRHQLSLPLVAGPGTELYMVVGDSRYTDRDLEDVRRLQPLVAGLHKHVALLARLAHGDSPEPASTDPALTPRERAVLTLISDGSTVNSIATRLSISPRTVHKHQENLYRKLGAVDRLSAVLRAQQAGLLPLGSEDPRIR